MIHGILPCVDPARLYPADAAFMGRTDLSVTQMLGFQPLVLDTVTAMIPGLLGDRATVRHAAGAGPEVLQLYHRAGLVVSERLLTYETQQEAERLAEGLIAEGWRLFSPFPLPAGRFSDDAQLVPPSMYARLNSKERLGEIVPLEYLPHRRILRQEQLPGFEPDGPIFLKAGGTLATGGGFAVRPCMDRPSLDAAKKWFGEHRDDFQTVIVEEAVETVRSWCAGFAVDDAGCVCFGAAEQVFGSPSRQSGSVIDPEAMLPDEAKWLTEKVAERSRLLGFRGIGGLDIGLAADGSLKVFDPNFRFNSSTSQVLFHPAAAARAGRPASASFQATVGGPFARLVALLERPIDEGWFFPTRGFDGSRHPLATGHIITGFVLGKDRQDAEAMARRLLTALEPG